MKAPNHGMRVRVSFEPDFYAVGGEQCEGYLLYTPADARRAFASGQRPCGLSFVEHSGSYPISLCASDRIEVLR